MIQFNMLEEVNAETVKQIDGLVWVLSIGQRRSHGAVVDLTVGQRERRVEALRQQLAALGDLELDRVDRQVAEVFVPRLNCVGKYD